MTKKLLFMATLLLGTVATLTLTSCTMEKNNTENTSVNTQITEIVNNVGTYADEHKWSELENLFAEKVNLDYESFTGQPAENLAPSEIMNRWSAFLPGFDVTQHKLKNIEITKNGENYEVTADVRAIHTIENKDWIVDGSYDFTLNPDLKITLMKLNFEKTLGDNNLPTIASNRATFDSIQAQQQADLATVNDTSTWTKPANPVASELSDNENIKVIQNFFTAYGNEDLEGIRTVMDENVTWFIPGQHKLAGMKKGIDEVVDYFSLLQKAKFMAEPLIFAANDNYVVDVHRGYSNTGEDDVDMNWVLLYKIENGKIVQVQNFSADSYSADAFFDATYSYDDAQSQNTQNSEENTSSNIINLDSYNQLPTMEKITFDSNGTELVGNMYFPENYDENKIYPALVVMGSWTTVKEQMAGTYAVEFSKKGFITLAFDPRGFGESAGEPKFYENPDMKVEDIHSAVAYLKSRKDVADISAFGVCAGGGYTLIAGSENPDIKAVATAASWIHDAEAVKLFYGGEEGVQAKIEAAQQAKKKYEETGEVEYIKSISTTDETAAMFGPFDYYLNPKRGAIPEWSADKFAVMTWEDWLTYDPRPSAFNLDKPTIMVHSDGAVLPDYTKKYFEDIKTDNKKLIWIETDLASPMHQFEFYDNKALIEETVDTIAEFLKK